MAAILRPLSVADAREHAGALLADHWREIARNKQLMVLDPDWARYEALQDGGLLVSIGAWDGDQLVGYSVSLVTSHLHYSQLVVCQNDVLFVAESHRKSRLGLQLIRATEEAARERGARLMLWHAKQGTALDAIMSRGGYGVQDIIYSKEL